ncbi:MAG: alpha/beta hydrolase [Steroidobacteraceae bacterium]|nr:alpha/beta hydrolase [Steroidobacteraceae bacterium]
MNPHVRAYLLGLGTEFTPQMAQGTQRFFAERFAGIEPHTDIIRDQEYGAHERQRLDVFTTRERKDAPVLVFVHGGGFVMGDKRMPDMPFYDNVGDFAVRSGYVGVTMTYRLAPAHPWPAGTEDVALAVAWVRENIARHGGDPRRIVLMGQSAGAVHVAGYVAHSRFHPGGGPGIAGALMISGSYDVAVADPNPFHTAYYGADREKWAACSTLEGLAASAVPLFFSVSELDAADFHRQAAALVPAFMRARGTCPPLHWLPGHNHLSPVLAIGSHVDTLGPRIREFISAVVE